MKAFLLLLFFFSVSALAGVEQLGEKEPKTYQEKLTEFGEMAKGMSTEELQKEFDQMLVYETKLEEEQGGGRYETLDQDPDYMPKKMAFHMELQARKENGLF